MTGVKNIGRQAKEQNANTHNINRRMGYSFSTYMKRYGSLYALLIVPIAFFVLFRYIPMPYVLQAFKTNNILRPPWTVEWADHNGMYYFELAFKNPEFISFASFNKFITSALGNTIFLNLMDLIIGMPMPIIMALLLNELAFPKYKRLTQTVLYLPHFLSWVIISTIALRLFATDRGLVNMAMGTNVNYLGEDWHWRGMYIFLGIWKECGWNTIIYLAALTAISPELYEAAEVDGATRLQKIWHVTLPGIRSTIVILLIMNLGHILGSDFDRPFTLRNDLVKGASNTLSIFVYKYGIQSTNYSLSTAVGLFQSVVCVIFLLASNAMAKRFGERGVW